MSELITATKRGNIRWHLLGTASAASLLISLSAPDATLARESDQPVVWIELGGQLEQLSFEDDPYGAAFTFENLNKPLNAVSPLSVQHPPSRSFGGEGKLTFAPPGIDWQFSAGVRFGRSNGKKGLHQQTSTQFSAKTFFYQWTPAKYGHQITTTTRFNDVRSEYSESHAVVDFSVGKDVGLGMFGGHASSFIGFGVRYAQFHTHAHTVLKSFPDIIPHTKIANSYYRFHSYFGTGDFTHNFRGVGPSLSWTGSAPMLGDADSGEITFDWGVNAAVLFGRQTVQGSHETRARYFQGVKDHIASQYTNVVPINRSRSLVSPNVGGLAGISVKYPNAKISFGYRVDFFFGAMDAGIDARHTENVSFHGPFATISVGLGG